VDPYAETIQQYVAFAAEGAGSSPCLEDWSMSVAEDPEVIAWIDSLPLHKRQPNLVFAAARWHGVPAPGPYDGLRAALLSDDDGAIRHTILNRATQTNEVGRLATLVPAFAAVSQGEPLAIVEAGASAGLCLYPDGYSYTWHTEDGQVRIGSGPMLTAAVSGPAPLPDAPPVVAWRGGVDLNPLDPTDAGDVQWLSTLIWPEHDDRRAQLLRAVEVARADPPLLRRGDLLDELPDLVDRAAEHGRVVVFHTAVIAYLTSVDRARFDALMRGMVEAGRCHWISNEGPGVLPSVTATGPKMPDTERRFVLGVVGQAVAWTHGHGRSMEWL
jgi:hypothetical protein